MSDNSNHSAENPLSEHDQQQIDRLVDDELPLDQQRELIGRLEELPGGWRRCALAFLEARAWKSDFLADDALFARKSDPHTEPEKVPAGVVEKSRRAKPSNLRWWSLAAMALLSFTLGIASGPHLFQGDSPQTPGTRTIKSSPKIVQQQPKNSKQPETQTVNWYELEVPSDGGGQPISVPVVEGLSPEGASEWLSQGQQQTSIPRELRQQLESQGHRVIEERVLVPVPLGDGREVWLPYYEVQIQPAGQRDFQ